MRTIALTITFLMILGMNVFAQSADPMTLRVGQQRLAGKTGLTIRFISVTEDSRCPVGVDCIWAGNAKVKVQVSSRGMKKIFEFNTTAGPKGDILDGWAIRLESLTPQPHAKRKLRQSQYRATFSVERLTR